MKKNYKAPYCRPRFMSEVEPLMVSGQDEPKNPYEGGFSNEEYDEGA